MKQRITKLLVGLLALALLCASLSVVSFAEAEEGTEAVQSSVNPGDILKVRSTLTLHSDFDYNIIVAVLDGATLESVTVDGVALDIEDNDEEEYRVEGHKTHVARHRGIAPGFANNSFVVEYTVTLADGSELVASQTHSIAKYAEKILAGAATNEEYAKAEQVVVNMLSYIESAYGYKGEECPEITKARGDREPASLDESQDTETSLANTGITSAQLYLGNKPSIRFYLRNNFAGNVKISYTDVNGRLYELNPEVEAADDGRAYVQFSVRVYNLTRVFYVDVDGLVGTFDVFDYLKLLGESDTARALIVSLLGYSHTSKDYKAPDKHTVRFDTDRGEYLPDEILDRGVGFELPEEPKKYGHRFLGWYYGEEKLENGFTPDSDVVIKAKWESRISEGLKYTLSSDKSYYIVTGMGDCTDTDIVIPMHYEGLPVREIGSGTFERCNTLTSVEIPDGIKTIDEKAFNYCRALKTVTFGENSQLSSIGEHAFSDCRSLTNIEIPDSVTSIGGAAFSGCSSLLSIEIPGSVESIGSSAFNACAKLSSVTICSGVKVIGNTAFSRCTKLKSIKIPNTVTSIGELTFRYCSGLTSVDIPNSVTNIGNYAFENCSSLTSIKIPDSVTSIGRYTFNMCSRLTSVTIGNSVTSIGSSAFYGCDSLTSIVVSGDNAAYKSIDGNLYAKDGRTLIQYATGKDDTEFVIPSDVETIGDSAFAGCDSLTSVTIGNSVTSIGDAAFSGCTSLTSIVVSGENVAYKSIDGNLYAKDGKTLIRYAIGKANNEFAIPDGVETIVNSAFAGCDSLTSVTIGNSVTSIGDAAFFGCDSLTSIEIPDSVKTIGSEAFSYCSALGAITFGENSQLSSVGEWAFRYCNSGLYAEYEYGTYVGDKNNPYSVLISISSKSYSTYTINEAAKHIADGVFENCRSLTSITIPDGVKVITEGTFDSCVALKTVTFGENSQLLSIGSSAFSGCDSLTSVEIPDSVETIGEDAFRYCERLTSITIPDSVTSIGSYAFYNCDSLMSIEIPESVTSIGQGPFSQCNSLTSIEVATDNSAYKSIDGNLYTKDGKILIQYATGKDDTEFVIPSDVETIGDSAFAGCDSPTSITIPDDVETISSHAFSSCSALETVTIGENSKLTSIGDSAFSNCDSLTSITIPDSVTSIGEDAFWNCDNLTSITIPDSVTSIGEDAFYGCDNLTSIKIPDSVTSIGSSAFSSCTSLMSIEVSSDNSSYMSIDGNLYSKDGKTLIQYAIGKASTEFVIPEGVENIGGYAFCGCSSLTSITILDGVKTIGYHAFSSCSALKTVTFGENSQLLSIYSSAFSECDSLTSITIPDSVTSIGSSAFSECDSLTSITIPDSVTSIGSSAFYGCDKLVEIYNRSSLDIKVGSSDYGFVGYYALNVYTLDSGESKLHTTNDEYVFYEDGDICYLVSYEGSETELILPKDCNGKNYDIYDYAFYNCDSLTSIMIPDSVKTIGSNAFHSCSALKTVTFGENSQLTSIGSWAFRYCESLTSIEIPKSVTTIGNYAFYSCNNLTDVYYGGGEEDWAKITIGTNNENLTNATIHFAIVYSKGLEFTENSDGTYTVSGIGTCEDTDIIIPPTYKGKAVTGIDEGAFYDCTVITSIELPDSVTSIGREAFSLCDSLTSIRIPDSVTSIGSSAFSHCYSLTNVIIGSGVTSIGEFAFSCCDSLTSITVDANNEAYKSIDGNLYTKDGKTLIQYAIGKTDTNFVIPDAVETIGNDAFVECESLVSVIIGNNVVNIGDFAFEYCSKLVSVEMTNSVKYIGDYAFQGTNLTSIDISDSTIWIGECAFNSCRRLTSIEIPGSVTWIGSYAFYDCTSLTDVYYGGSEEDWAKVDIGEDNECLTNATIHFAKVEIPVYKDEYDFLNDTPMIWDEEFVAD